MIRNEHSHTHLKILFQSDGKWTMHLQDINKKKTVGALTVYACLNFQSTANCSPCIHKTSL